MSLSPVQSSALPAADIAPPSHSVQRPQASSAPTLPGVADKGTPPSHGEIEKALNTLNQYTATVAPDIQFSKDAETGIHVIKMVDVTTNTVLRQIPSEEALAIARSIDKMRGFLINQKA